MSGQLCLSWNNHATALNNVLRKLYLEEVYSDATIFCEGNFYPVHRLVLSTCSEYFEEMFRHCVTLNNKHPFIIVKDVQSTQMEALLNYIYKGEVNVPQEMLPELIKAAEVFKVKGLAVPDDPIPSKPSKKRRNLSSPEPLPKKSYRQNHIASPSSSYESKRGDCTNKYSTLNSDDQSLPSNESGNEDINIIEPNNPIFKSEPIDEIGDNALSCDSFGEVSAHNDDQEFVSTKNDESKCDASEFESSDAHFLSEVESTSWDNSQHQDSRNNADIDPSHMPVDGSPPFSIHDSEPECSVGGACPYPGCTFKYTSPSLVKVHYRSHTGEKPFKCNHCSYKTAQRGNLQIHLNSVHMKNKPFWCTMCSFSTGHKSSLKLHMKRYHSNSNSI